MTLAYFAGKPWLSMYAHVRYAWMQYALTNRWILPLGCQNWRASWLMVSFWKGFLGNRCQVVWKSYSWLNTMGEFLHPYIELRTLRVHTCTDSSTKRWTFKLSKFDEPFGVRFYFERFFENRCRLVWRSYSWLDMTRLYTPHVEFGNSWGLQAY